jgi:molecular chaperone HscB
VAAGTPSPSADGIGVGTRSLHERQSLGHMSDPYDTLGLSPVFELDAATLERRHRELSRALHPDRYAGRPPSERQRALGRAIEVNEAFRQLREPVGRAEALLVRLGRPVGEASASPAAPALLMEVMEQREALGEARQKRDLAKVRALLHAVRSREQRVVSEMAKAFVQQPPDVPRIETLLGELRYHRRFLEEAGAVEDDLDGNPA